MGFGTWRGGATAGPLHAGASGTIGLEKVHHRARRCDWHSVNCQLILHYFDMIGLFSLPFSCHFACLLIPPIFYLRFLVLFCRKRATRGLEQCFLACQHRPCYIRTYIHPSIHTYRTNQHSLGKVRAQIDSLVPTYLPT